MDKVIPNANPRGSLPVIVMKILALFIFTMGCIWILIPETHAKIRQVHTLGHSREPACCPFFCKSAYTRKTILILTAIAVSGYFIEVIGINTGRIFGLYTYGKTLGLPVQHSFINRHQLAFSGVCFFFNFRKIHYPPHG